MLHKDGRKIVDFALFDLSLYYQICPQCHSKKLLGFSLFRKYWICWYNPVRQMGSFLDLKIGTWSEGHPVGGPTLSGWENVDAMVASPIFPYKPRVSIEAVKETGTVMMRPKGRSRAVATKIGKRRGLLRLSDGRGNLMDVEIDLAQAQKIKGFIR